MIEVVIDSIRISLVSQHRIVMLKDIESEQQLAIWIGPCEAEAITIELQNTKVARPLTHDLLRNAIEAMGGTVTRIVVNDLREAVFYATLYVEVNGEVKEVDCRPSDAIALAVRTKVPIFVEEHVLEEAGILPESDIQEAQGGEDEPESLDAFSDFVDTLDFDDLDES